MKYSLLFNRSLELFTRVGNTQHSSARHQEHCNWNVQVLKHVAKDDVEELVSRINTS